MPYLPSYIIFVQYLEFKLSTQLQHPPFGHLLSTLQRREHRYPCWDGRYTPTYAAPLVLP
uniref:Uncharacterized protein n=1 Tax=Romanomermis culicivorax TaxID=13658 RepID=A0A915ISV6_ROMCU